ncbi:MAG: VOC family protein [Burkholderiales bacterium]|nr:VOC family protein [Burkholderiales bacterium]
MTESPLIPCLRYRDASKAIDWLCSNFGFEPQLVVPSKGNVIQHAQLRLGNSMVMLGSVQPDSEYGKLMKQPAEAGGCTQSIYLVVRDPDAVYKKVKAAGAKIAMEIKDEDYGGRGFACHDLEGHLWSIGSYDPWN